MLSRKKRDAKFLIFQSLYIIAIAILFYKGTDLSLTPVIPYTEGDTVIAKINLPSTDLGVYDPKMQEVLPILPSDSEYVKALKGEVLVSQEELDKKNARIAELERLKTPTRQNTKIDDKSNEKTGINTKFKGVEEK